MANEQTSKKIATLAAKVLANDGKGVTPAQAKSLAGSVLTQREPAKPAPKGKK